jgi:hypothetical protein
MWDQEGFCFCNSFIQQRFSSKSNGTAKASVNGNGIAQKILTTILS